MLSGVYPAFYLSSIPPIAALTAIKRAATAQLKSRQILVLAQFVISIGVIASTFLMVSQMKYITNKPLGFDKQNRVVFRIYGADVFEKKKTIKSELLKNPNVLGVTVCSEIPGRTNNFNMSDVEKNDGTMEQQTYSVMLAHNDDYLPVMGMELLEGRDFSQKLLTDVGESVIVNETMVKNMGWDEPLGKRIQLGLNASRVIGVVKDFNFKSMHSPIEPLVLLRNDPDFSGLDADHRARQSRMMVIHINGEDMPQTLSHIRDVMGEFDPRHALEYDFLDETLDQLYVSEKQIIELTGLFAGICVLISCLGLFGLSAFITEQRTKEIGVRKVLGATSTQIIFMLSRPSLILVVIASVIASTSTYLAMGEWLAGFAYRAEINPLVFVMATLLVIIVAFVTIALQSLKTAQANPVKALRYE
jgi:putative ABC transport system permease protein